MIFTRQRRAKAALAHPSTASRDHPRVLVLTSTFPDAPGDGTPSFVLDLAMGISGASDIDVTVVAPRSPNSGSTQDFSGIRIVRFAYGPRRLETFATTAIMPEVRAQRFKALLIPSFLIGFWIAARNELRTGAYDLVHAHWIVPAGIIAGLLGKPYVVTVHGTDAHALNGSIMPHLKRWSARGARAVIPVSRSLAQLLRSQGIQSTEPIPMGVNVQQLSHPRHGCQRDPHKVLFVGRLAPNKGAAILIRAIHLVPEAHLTIVGDGPERASLDELVKDLNLSTRVVFTGKLDHSAVLTHLQTAALFVAPSVETDTGDAEGFSMVAAEAMASGLPVICSDICGITEYLTDGINAVIVHQKDHAVLAKAIVGSLTESASAKRRAQRAMLTAERELSIEKSSSRYAHLYRQILTGAASREKQGRV